MQLLRRSTFRFHYGKRPTSAPSQQAGAEAPHGTRCYAVKNELVAWVEERGGKVSGVELVKNSAEGGWGLQAAQDAAPGTRLIELPAACHLTYGRPGVDTDDDPRLLALIEQVPAELWGARLALKVLHHRLAGPSSPFGRYISLLPLGVSGLPMFFNRDEVAALEYPPVTEQVAKRGRWLLQFSRDVLAKLPGTPQDPFAGVAIDINALGWALGVVSSRAFATRGPSQPSALLPLIDMCNHCFEPNVEVLPVGAGAGAAAAAAGATAGPGGAMAMFAKRKISAGEPLLLSYGSLTNDYLLLDYGFVVPGNPHDAVTLRYDVGLLQTAAMLAGLDESQLGGGGSPWKKALLEKLQLEGPGANTEVALRAGPQPVDPRLLAATRLLLCRDQAELEGKADPARLKDWSKPLNGRNEVAALKTLAAVAAVAMAQFSTSIEQDTQALAAGHDGPLRQQQPGASSSSSSKGGSASGAGAANAAPPQPLTDNMKLAIQFRLNKKQLLRSAIQLINLRVGEVSAAMPAVAGTAAGGRKGEAPPAATSKGFGAKPPASKS